METAKYANPETAELAKKLEEKIESYHHWPSSRKLGEKLIVFTESDELVLLLADIARHDKWEEYPQFKNNRHQGFATIVHILLQYVMQEKPRSQEVITALEHIMDSACEVVLRNEFNNRYYILRCMFGFYKKAQTFPKELFKRLDAVPSDQLLFRPFALHETDTIKSIYGSIEAYVPKDYEVSGYREFTCGDIKIPQTHNGLPVAIISGYGFSGSKITSVELPEGLEEIGMSAFSNTKIKSIKLPQSLKIIKKYAFAECLKLTEITIPQGVTEIEREAFHYSEIKTIFVEGHSAKPDRWDDNWNRYSPETFIDVKWGAILGR